MCSKYVVVAVKIFENKKSGFYNWKNTKTIR